ncbi:glycogen synthase GlgA [Bacillus sp. M6-12]|uniref:glycogen synthase GlgA n=1 Tax=Bacillus sp. M6-12 TaxID=2054166 RepID=UPI000C778593|nr:glycogen synthase GlgA [Bacillus sp. M6-12]PLS14965.1 glycogen synthase GlgA [Bacillus sp. M6-12]
MKVLFVVSECVPFEKSGGLADVAGSLPKELKKQGTDVRVVMPKYGSIPEHFRSEMEKKAEYTVQVGWRSQYCGIEVLESDGLIYYFIDNEYYFKRGSSLYGHYDDGERFSFFCRAVLEMLEKVNFIPDVLHCHDWHTGMIPFLYKTEYQRRAGYGHIKNVFTIHNLQFQGIFPREILGEVLGVSDYYFHPEQLEFYGNVNFMKAALVASDFITTVSPTYTSEIQTPYFGERLDSLLRYRKKDLTGILNGIDDEVYNPEKDSFLAANFSSQKPAGKAKNKAAIQKHFGLPEIANKPLIAMVTRLTKQKGLDLVQAVLHEIMEEDIQMIVLGTGDREFENFFREMAAQYPEKLRVQIGFDERLAHKIYAGADLFLMPSQFEPCGLGQLIAMRYGAIPVVRETGGLNDTVTAFREDTGEGNGFSFTNFNAHDMLFTIRRAIHYYHNKTIWKTLLKRAMEQDNSWAQSAFKYNSLYAGLGSRSESHVF